LVVERGDIGAGTSSGVVAVDSWWLRYLEYGELGLVYESLHERESCCACAAFVKPLDS